MRMRDELCLTDEMLGVLASLKGKTLKSYEADLGGCAGDRADSVVVLNTGSARVPVFRQEEPRELFGEVDDYAPLECIALGPDEPYFLDFDERTRLYLVEERVGSVEVVRDTGAWEEDGDERVLVEDEAVVIRTSGHTLALSSYGFEEVVVRMVDSPDAEPPVLSVDDYWGEGFHVERETIKL